MNFTQNNMLQTIVGTINVMNMPYINKGEVNSSPNQITSNKLLHDIDNAHQWDVRIIKGT
jgi:hypothetical protein